MDLGLANKTGNYPGVDDSWTLEDFKKVSSYAPTHLHT
jgi:hypothetical protein